MDRFALVVDDESFNRETIRKILEKLDYQIIEASNGKEAVEIFLNHPQKFSLMTIDYNMPIMNGVEAIKAIRKHNKNIPIIGITASTQTMHQQLENEKDIPILSKPIDEFKLKIIINGL